MKLHQGILSSKDKTRTQYPQKSWDFFTPMIFLYSSNIMMLSFPNTGWMLGSRFSSYIENVDHWIAFTLLLFIGIKMIFDSFTEVEENQSINPLDHKVLLFLSLATSIDALAVGVTFAFLDVSILFSIISIGIITFILSTLGIIIGKISGERLKKKAELFGGIVLALIGIKILL